jgi:hypothetical protein
MPPVGTPGPIGGVHKRTTSNAPSPSVSDMRNLFLSGGRPETSPTRGSTATPTPRELFGSSASFPIKDRDILQPREQYSSLSFRKSLDFDRAPQLPPARSARSPDLSTSPAPQPHHALIRAGGDLEDVTSKVTVHDIHTISSQLAGITTIATSLQREMTSLSRRSKDNATDLMALKEAAKSRDEEIRRSLRDLQNGLTSFEATDRLLEGRNAHLSLGAPSISSGSDRGSNYGDDSVINPKFAAASTQALERILREMPSKAEQDRALDLLRDIQHSLKEQQSRPETKGEAEEKILAVLEEIRDRDASRGKEIALRGTGAGALLTHDDDVRILAMLEDLKHDLRQDRSGEEKIMSILEEIREKEVGERSDERILSAIDELKAQDTVGDERLDRVISLLEELRDKDGDEKVLSMLEEVRAKLEIMSEDMEKEATAPISLSLASSDGSSPTPLSGDVLVVLKEIQDAVTAGGLLGKEIKGLVQDWREIWTGHDRSVGDALKDLGGQIEVLAAVQRAAMARMPTNGPLGLPSQALTTTNPPLPPDLDNEAAITALANIASTTTRTDITLSSINALVKVFQKESYHANTNNTEGFATLGRFLEEIGQAVGTSNAQAGDIRKVLEVVRTGVQSGNDRQAESEHRAARQVEELIHLHKNLQRTIMGDDEEALWKVDLGVKDDVEELSRKVDELFDKNTEILTSTSAKTLEIINTSNPAALIEELKSALGAMAQRSLDAFKKSEEAIQQLKEASTTSAERNIEAIQNANPAVAIADFRTEVKEMAEKSYALCEAIDAKSNSDEVKDILAAMKQELADLTRQAASTESADIKAYIDKMREDIDAKMEDSITTAVTLASADEKTAAALAELKSEVAETLSKAVVLAEKGKILEPIRELRQEVLDMIEKSNTALAAPVHYPEADEIKSKIERLSRELMGAVVKTADLVGESVMSSGDTSQQIKATVDTLRADINAMGSSIAAAVAGNSATAVEEGINGAFEDMKKTVLSKVEQSLLTSDKAVSCIADLSQQTRDSINDLKKEVMDMMNKSISMAIATANSDDSESKNQSLLDALETKITDVVISSMAASTNTDDLKELIESLKSDIDGMGKLIAVPTPGSDATLKKLLQELKDDVTGIVSAAASSQETKQSVDELRREVREMMDKTSSMVSPVVTSPSAPIPTGPTSSAVTIGSIEAAIANLKDDVNELVEKSLAAAIANSTFDSEEKVKESIEELKRDVRDTLEKSMVPLPQQANHESSRMVREAMELLRQELDAMFQKRAIGEAEDREQMMGKLDSLKGQFGELLEKSTDVEVKEAVDVLKIQVHGLLEKSMGAEYAELKDMLKAINGQVVVRQPMPADDEVNVILEALRCQVEELYSKLNDEDMGATLTTLKTQVEQLSSRPVATDNSELKEAIASLKTHIDGMAFKAGSDAPSPGFNADELKATIEGSISNLSKANDVLAVKTLIEEFKGEFAAAMEKQSIESLEALKADLKAVLEKSASVSGQPVDAENLHEAIEQLRSEVKELIAQSGGRVASSPSEPTSVRSVPFASLDLREAVTDTSLAVGECRVEVAIVKALLEEKSDEANAGISGLNTAIADSQNVVTESISGVKDSISNAQEVLNQFQAETKDSILAVQGAVEGLQTANSESIAAATSAICNFRADAQVRISEVKSVLESMKEETKDGIEEINKTVEGTQVELKEVVTALDKKIEVFQDGHMEATAEVKSLIGESKAETLDGFLAMTSTLEGAQTEAKEEFTAVKKLVETSHSVNEAEHEKTQKQISEVMGLVDGFQTEWKGQQPTLFDALVEMKALLLEAQASHRAAASKPDIELPPPYDDSRAQDKLDQLLTETSEQSKLLPQLNLLETIQQQVAATSASIAQFLERQKSRAADDAAAKVEQARKAELDLEKAITEKRLIEAATERLREEHDKLQVSVDVLQEENEDLRAKKLGFVSELAVVETSIKMRREEMDRLEDRTRALERRMMDDILEKSRTILAESTNGKKKARPPPTVKPMAKPDRRYFSQNQASTPANPSIAGRLSSVNALGLGQKDYSSIFGGGLNRSQSVKYTSFSTGRRSPPTMVPNAAQENMQPFVDEEAEFEEVEAYPESEDEGSVVRVPIEEADDKDYPGLSLDFGGSAGAGSRRGSGVSSLA